MKLSTEQAAAWQRLEAKEALAHALISRAQLRNSSWQDAANGVSVATSDVLHGLLEKVADDKAYFLDSLILAAKREADRG